MPRQQFKLLRCPKFYQKSEWGDIHQCSDFHFNKYGSKDVADKLLTESYNKHQYPYINIFSLLQKYVCNKTAIPISEWYFCYLRKHCFISGYCIKYIFLIFLPDIDECSSNPCEHGSTCNNLVNNYTCTCTPGYDGYNCQHGTYISLILKHFIKYTCFC